MAKSGTTLRQIFNVMINDQSELTLLESKLTLYPNLRINYQCGLLKGPRHTTRSEGCK